MIEDFLLWSLFGALFLLFVSPLSAYLISKMARLGYLRANQRYKELNPSHTPNGEVHVQARF